MLRRTFNWSTPGSLLALGAALSGCTTASSSDASRTEQMDKRRTIDAGVDSMLARLYDIASGSREPADKAHGVLVFPSVFDAGVVVGGQYGEGSMRVARTHGRLLQHGDRFDRLAVGRAIARDRIPVHDRGVAHRFRSTDGWSAAGDASVAALKIGPNGNLDTSTATGQVNAFVLTNHGLMAGLRSKSPKSRGSRRFENHTQGRGVMRGPS
jgi:lipid-binding SYLF domain-containing protein